MSFTRAGVIVPSSLNGDEGLNLFRDFKRQVMALRKSGICSSHAHEVVARSLGFKTYLSLRAAYGVSSDDVSLIIKQLFMESVSS